jgi:hypothetical protein
MENAFLSFVRHYKDHGDTRSQEGTTSQHSEAVGPYGTFRKSSQGHPHGETQCQSSGDCPDAFEAIRTGCASDEQPEKNIDHAKWHAVAMPDFGKLSPEWYLRVSVSKILLQCQTQRKACETGEDHGDEPKNNIESAGCHNDSPICQ